MQTQIQNNPKVKSAYVDLIKELGIDKLSPEKQEKLLLQMNEVIQQRILLLVAEELNEDERKELDVLLTNENATPEQLDAFLAEKSPELEGKILGVIGEYKEEMMQFMQNITKE